MKNLFKSTLLLTVLVSFVTLSGLEHLEHGDRTSLILFIVSFFIFISAVIIRIILFRKENKNDIYNTQAQQIREKEDKYFLNLVDEKIKEKEIKEKPKINKYKFIQN